MLILEKNAHLVLQAPANRGKHLKSLSQPVKHDGQGWSFQATAAGIVKETIPRALVLTFQFYDAHGTLLDLSTGAFTYSDALKSRFSYVAVDTKGSAVRVKPFLPPVGTARIEYQLQRWQCPDNLQLDCKLAIEPHEFSLDQLPMFEAADSPNAERIAWRLLELHPTSRPHLLDVQAFAWRVGAARLLGKASRLLDAAPDARGYMRHQARLALAALDEMDNWIPEAGPVAAHSGMPHRVAHLAASGEGEILELACTQFDRGMRPLVLIPSSYNLHASAGSPYTRQEHRGVEVVSLSALMPEAVHGVPRTDLARFDVLLAEPCLRQARIGLLHAHVGRSGFDLAARALALGKRYSLPVVMNWPNPQAPLPNGDAMAPPPGSEWAAMAHRQQLRCARLADAVIVEDGWQAWLLRKQGISPDRIFVLPDLIAVPSLDPPPPGSNKHWLAVLDLRHVDPSRIETLASTLPEAIGRKGIRWQVIGNAHATRRIEQALTEAGLKARLDTGTDLPPRLQAHVIVRLQPAPQAHRQDWLSDIHEQASSGTLILAESTPQSDYVVRNAGIGLTFDFTDPRSFVQAFSDLAPSRPVSTQLRRNLRGLRAARADADQVAASIDRVYHHALCSLG